MTSGGSVVRKIALKAAFVVWNNVYDAYKKDVPRIKSREDDVNLAKKSAIDLAVDVLGGKIADAAGGKVVKDGVHDLADKAFVQSKMRQKKSWIMVS